MRIILSLTVLMAAWLLTASGAADGGEKPDHPPPNCNGVLTLQAVNDRRSMFEPYCTITLDYDNDGREDVLETRLYGPPALYRNECDDQCGRPIFSRIFAFDSMIESLSSARNCVAADYDGDGFVDIFIAHETYPMLLRNRGPGKVPRFENVGTSLAWIDNDRVEYVLAGSWSGRWVDVDCDGTVDLVVARSIAGSGAAKVRTEDLVLINHSRPGVTSFVPDCIDGERGYTAELMMISAVAR